MFIFSAYVFSFIATFLAFKVHDNILFTGYGLFNFFCRIFSRQIDWNANT